MPRLDVFMSEIGLCKSRETAKKLITQGFVTVDGAVCKKPSESVSEHSEILCTGDEKYVGRGGFKLEKLLSEAKVDLSNKVCADIGASTGGFTDCMLQSGALRVYSIDVGHNQLAAKLREDTRVISIEGMNVRDMNEGSIPEKVDFISVDISFISLKLAVLPLLSIMKDDGYLALLIKPQFEVGRENVGKGGIVKSQKSHIRMLYDITDFFHENGLFYKWFSFSQIRGGDGNIEYLALLSKESVECKLDVDDVVLSAFTLL